MISSETPYKVVEIIHDTWPNLYRPPKDYHIKRFDYNTKEQYNKLNKDQNKK